MIGSIQGKIWGNTQCIFSFSNVEVHRIEAVNGGYSSIHHHVARYNFWFTEKGSFEIKIFRASGAIDTTLLKAGMSTTIAPGEQHQFCSLEDGSVAYEIYYVVLDPDDIVRVSQGGIDESGITIL